ncbi:MAG: hypothetical protein WED33_03665 [Bacteroidia bacterium]
MNYLRIEKEELPMIPLRKIESRELQVERKLHTKLREAVILGNTFKLKCILRIQTEDGVGVVNTTLWYASDDHICLKGGVTIPITCILDVQI